MIMHNNTRSYSNTLKLVEQKKQATKYSLTPRAMGLDSELIVTQTEKQTKRVGYAYLSGGLNDESLKLK